MGTKKGEHIAQALIMLLAGAGLFLGWRFFWFLTDDAYIAFRYISNSVLGHGYVWNPPPFLPVEGYTSFLWIALLDVVWRVTGVQPPDSANWISLGFAYGTLLLAVALVGRIRWQHRLRDIRLVFIAFLLLFLLVNRTFLTWSSSGLESAMMHFFLFLWLYLWLSDRLEPGRLCFGSIIVAALALTRPDGLLLCATTALLILFEGWKQTEKRNKRTLLLYGFLPFGIVLAHLIWRFMFYGQWLPNTYYAKVVDAWPQSGIRYLFSFILEYALWFPLAIVAPAVLKKSAFMVTRLHKAKKQQCLVAMLKTTLAKAGRPSLVIVTILLHFGYYTFIVGGDHFEYRIYTYLIPLIFVALIWSINILNINRAAATAIAIATILLSLPLQWSHWAATKHLCTRHQTVNMQIDIAPHWPKPVQWYAGLFDDMQKWLIVKHAVCTRYREHRVFWLTQINSHPSREEGLEISAAGHPVYAVGTVGVPSWVLPNVYIIDTLGLNDYVIARTPVKNTIQRRMAHSRRAPSGYISSYKPNVKLYGHQIVVRPRTQPFGSRDILQNERYWRNTLKQKKLAEQTCQRGWSNLE